MILRALLAALTLGIAVPAAAQSPAPIDPRARAEAAAAAIEAEYFDPRKGAAIAADLRKAASAGAFDGLRDPRDFAGALSARLRPLDGHFQAQWAPPRTAAAAPARGPRDPAAFDAEMRRVNHGFRDVAVLPGNIGYVDMRMFAHFEGGDGPARSKADAVMATIADTDAVIFDLRQNGGGSPAMVGYLASHFVPADAKIYNTFKSRGPDAFETPTAEIRGKRRLEVPLYILVSGRTASAAESFAYTLQAAKRAVIVGAPTAGGANPGDFHPIGEGLRLFISDGSPVNPLTGKNWEGTGVVPDVATDPAEALARAQVLALQKLAQAPMSETAATENRWILESLQPPPAGAPAPTRAGDYGLYSVRLTDGELILRQGRRPPVALIALNGSGLYTLDGNPLLRLQFEPDALVVLTPGGSASRFPRTPAK